MKSRSAWLNLLAVCVFLYCFSSCSDGWWAKEREDRRALRSKLDSLATSGEHGYYPALYFVGRFSTTRMKVDPFRITVSQVDLEMENRAITFQHVDSTSYLITYDLNGSHNVQKGAYGTVLQTKELELLARGALPGENSTRVSSALSLGTYELRIFKY